MQFSLRKCVNLEASLFIIYLNLNTCKHNIINKSIKVWVYIDIQHVKRHKPKFLNSMFFLVKVKCHKDIETFSLITALS